MLKALILSLRMSRMKEYELLTTLFIIRNGGLATAKLVFKDISFVRAPSISVTDLL